MIYDDIWVTLSIKGLDSNEGTNTYVPALGEQNSTVPNGEDSKDRGPLIPDLVEVAALVVILLVFVLLLLLLPLLPLLLLLLLLLLLFVWFVVNLKTLFDGDSFLASLSLESDRAPTTIEARLLLL